MTLTKENRSIYLDEEIELLGKTVRRPIFKMYEQEISCREIVLTKHEVLIHESLIHELPI